MILYMYTTGNAEVVLHVSTYISETHQIDCPPHGKKNQKTDLAPARQNIVNAYMLDLYADTPGKEPHFYKKVPIPQFGRSLSLAHGTAAAQEGRRADLSTYSPARTTCQGCKDAALERLRPSALHYNLNLQS